MVRQVVEPSGDSGVGCRDMRVLMVGAGIAGSTLAYCLRRLEHQPTLVDWAPEMRRGGYLVDY